VDPDALRRTAGIASISLAALWATGLVVVFMDTGFDPAILAGKPKVIAKIVVVAALTANGGLLHLLAFPMLEGTLKATRVRARICAALGAVSSVSWVYAAFVGSARVIAPQTTLAGFLGLYGAALVGGVGVGVVFVGPLIERRLKWAAIRAELLGKAPRGEDQPPEQSGRKEARKAA
jgi:hypothetical protein